MAEPASPTASSPSPEGRPTTLIDTKCIGDRGHTYVATLPVGRLSRNAATHFPAVISVLLVALGAVLFFFLTYPLFRGYRRGRVCIMASGV